MGTDQLPDDISSLYEVYEWRHACAILSGDFPQEWTDIIEVLHGFRLLRSHVAAPGRNISLISSSIAAEFTNLHWEERSFRTSMTVDDVCRESHTHKVDCFKNRVALEVEWNSKDTTFGRDLNNFRLLFDLDAVSVGVIITRSDELADIIGEAGRKRYGCTTHMSKLLPRIEGGGGGGCPLLVFGITKKLYVAD